MTREEVINQLQDAKDGYEEYLTEEAINMAIQALSQEPCDDAISRQAVLDEINRIGIKAFETYTDYSQLYDFVDTLPSVTQKPIEYDNGNPNIEVLDVAENEE